MPEDQSARQDPRAEFIKVSVWHGSLDRAQEILAEHPEVASSDIHTAAVLGDHEVVGRFLCEPLSLRSLDQLEAACIDEISSPRRRSNQTLTSPPPRA